MGMFLVNRLHISNGEMGLPQMEKTSGHMQTAEAQVCLGSLSRFVTVCLLATLECSNRKQKL